MLPLFGSSSSFEAFGIKRYLIQRERKSLWDSHLDYFSFKRFNSKAKCFFSGSLTKVDVEGPITKIDGLISSPHGLLAGC